MTSADPLSFIHQDLSNPIWKEVLSLPSEHIHNKIDQISQEVYKCQYELLSQIEHKSPQYTLAVDTSKTYFSLLSSNHSSLHRLHTLSTQFNREYTRDRIMGMGRGVMAKREWDGVRQCTEWGVMAKRPNRVEELAAVQKIGEDMEERKGGKSEVVEKVQRYSAIINQRYFQSCLMRSLSNVTLATFEKNIGSIVPVWNALQTLKVDDKMETLFGFLTYRLSKNTTGKLFTGDIPVPHLTTLLESFVSLNNTVLASIQQLNTESPSSHPLTLRPSSVLSIRSSILFLISTLARRGQLVDKVDSPFVSSLLLDTVKMQIFTVQCEETLAAIRAVMYSGVEESEDCGFGGEVIRFLKSDTGEFIDVEEENRVVGHAVQNFVRLVKYFASARVAFSSNLSNQSKSAEFDKTINTMIDQLLTSLTKFHKTKTLLDKDLLTALKNKLLA
jgi:hypothetical protein